MAPDRLRFDFSHFAPMSEEEKQKVEDLVNTEVRANGATATASQGDLTEDAFLDGLFSGAPLHALAHCAGILAARDWRNDADWRNRFHRVMDINVRVPLEITMRAIDHMAAHGGGHIVLVGSVAGKTGGTSLNTPPDYSASKGAVHALVKWTSRHGVTQGVMVNAVAPGPVETPMTHGFNATPLLPMGRPRYLMGVGTPLDILEAVHRGVDMFDCIMPTQLAQRGAVFTSRGFLQLRRGARG